MINPSNIAKKIFFSLVIVALVSVTFLSNTNAQGMMDLVGRANSTEQADEDHTDRGESEGKIIWEKLLAKELNCEDLSEDDFHSLGMHFMGVMVGDSHEAMDTMMEQMMGEEGADQMHTTIGKRMSGCETDAPLPQSMVGGGMMPMMSMMMGGGGNTMMGSFGTNQMGAFGWSFGSWIIPLILIVWLFVGILAIIWLITQIKDKRR